ncbi:MAG: MFS transporter [Acidobacteria bacterium]|nr:MAG: MFS transporter [Acidobacteriota bacterium]
MTTSASGSRLYSVIISLIVALGGFLLGFDSAVISGATPFYKSVFGLPTGSWLIGLSVSAIILGAIGGNIIAGPLADRFGRKPILVVTAFLFGFCALGCALAQNVYFFIGARVIGGLGVGMAILIAPMFIAETAPRKLRGLLVTFNQLNIVLGISIAYFSNYYIQQTMTDTAVNWRWMLGVGLAPALAYFVLLFFVPESPRWLARQGREEAALAVLRRVGGEEHAQTELREIKASLEGTGAAHKGSVAQIFSKDMKTVMLIGFGIAFFQQITGINAIFYYAPMIFEMAGGGKDAAFLQASILGLTNLVMTLVAMALIDRLGRRPLLIIGASGLTLALVLAGTAFRNGSYTLTDSGLAALQPEIAASLGDMKGVTFDKEVAFFRAIEQRVGSANYNQYKELIVKNSITINSTLVLVSLILYVASFAISLGPVMWALLSEIFPNRIRGLAISIVGFWNSIVSFSVATVFPVELERLGSSLTYFIYALFGLLTVLFVLKFVPETKGKSLEQLEEMLVGRGEAKAEVAVP